MQQLSSMSRNLVIDILGDLRTPRAEVVLTTVEPRTDAIGDRVTITDQLRFWSDARGLRNLADYATKVAGELDSLAGNTAEAGGAT
mgnify:CR=1 FL=1